MKPTLKQKHMAIFFDALSHPRRLMLFHMLRDSGQSGMAIHQLLKCTNLTPATLSFHLGKMLQGRILKRKTKGSEVWFSVNHGAFAMLDSL